MRRAEQLLRAAENLGCHNELLFARGTHQEERPDCGALINDSFVAGRGTFITLGLAHKNWKHGTGS